MALPGLGAFLGGAAAKLGRKAVTWGVRRIGAGNVRRIGKVVGGAGRVVKSPGGQVVIGTGGAAVGGHVAKRRQMSKEAVVQEAFMNIHGREPTRSEYGHFLGVLNKHGEDAMLQQIAALPGAQGGGGGGGAIGGGGFGGGGFSDLLMADPEAYEAMRCPPGYVLVDLGDGPVCMNREVAYALGIRKRARRGGITAREVAAAKKVQRFGQGLFVNKAPRTKLKKGRR